MQGSKTGPPIQVRKVRPDDYEALMTYNFEAFPREYPQSPADFLAGELESPSAFFLGSIAEQYVAVTPGEVLMSGLATTSETMFFDGEKQKAALIHNVWTRPEYRKKGCVQRLMDVALPALAEEGHNLAYLTPFSFGFYRRFGFEGCVQERICLLRTEHLPKGEYDGYFARLETEKQKEDLRLVYHRFAKDYNLAVGRENDLLFHLPFGVENPHQDVRYTFLYYSDSGVPKAYVTHRGVAEQGADSVLDCLEIAFVSPDALRAVFSFLRGAYGGQFPKIKLRLPLMIDPSLFLLDWNAYGSRESVCSLYNKGMYRVLDVEAILLAAAYRGSGQLSIGVSDPILPKNNAVFTVLFVGGKAHQVTRGQGAEADVLLTIGDFTRLICGGVATKAVEQLADVVCKCPLNRLEPVFYEKPTAIFNSP